jgi:hypothetical protein
MDAILDKFKKIISTEYFLYALYRSRMAICWSALADRSDQDDDKKQEQDKEVQGPKKSLRRE